MTQPFLITGLPRSRTAWMAEASRVVDRVHCQHDPLAWLPTWDRVFDLCWAYRPGLEYAGVSDHGFGFHLPAIMQRTAPRTLIIERPIAEVEDSLRRLGMEPGNICALLAEALTFEHPQIRRVAYSDLTDTSVVLACLAWLTPGAERSAGRIDWLQGINIQADVERQKASARRRAGDVRGNLVPTDYYDRFVA